jgi:hypothetical protein
MANRDARSTLCITPIAGVVRYANGPEKLAIGDVRFLSWETLKATWGDQGFREDPTAFLREHDLDDLEPIDVVAVVPIEGSVKESVDIAWQTAVRAFQLLLACNPAWGPGGKHTRPIVGMRSKRGFGFVYGEDGSEPFDHAILGRSIGPGTHEIRFDGFWNSNRPVGFYDELNKLIASTTVVTPEWREQILDATGLLGHARLATTSWEAFLFSMIGLERLLKKSPKEIWRESVEPRLTALFSWLGSGSFLRYRDGIGPLYKLRNVVAHMGRVDAVRQRHAKLADEILFNLLLVAYKHLGEVKNLDDLAKRGALMEEQIARGERPTALPKACAVISAIDPEG